MDCKKRIKPECQLQCFIYYKKNKCSSNNNIPTTTPPRRLNDPPPDQIIASGTTTQTTNPGGGTTTTTQTTGPGGEIITAGGSTTITINPIDLIQRKALTPDFTLEGKNGIEMFEMQTVYGQRGKSHDPTSYDIVDDWEITKWDGVPFPNPCEKNLTPEGRTEILNWVFPTLKNDGAMRGLKEKYEKIKPFLNPYKPTPVEIENWHIEVLKHFREILGFTNPVALSKDFMVQARLSDERKRTTMWNTKYPEDTCPLKPPPHCGFTWLPVPEDRIKYFGGEPDNLPISAYSEGVFQPYTTTEWEDSGTANPPPWSLMLTRIINGTLSHEGIMMHLGPMLASEKIGFSYWWRDPEVTKSPLSFRLLSSPASLCGQEVKYEIK